MTTYFPDTEVKTEEKIWVYQVLRGERDLLFRFTIIYL